MKRRYFISLGAAGFVSLLGVGRLAAQPIEATVVPIPDGTPSATPSADLPAYDGPLVDIWDQPWQSEGMQVEFKGVILQRFTGRLGHGFAAGNDGLVFRSLVHMDIPVEGFGDRDLFVGFNGDIGDLRDTHVAHVIGVYGGKHEYLKGGGLWSVPLIIASLVESV